jgi:hypothetical protein
LIQILLRLMRKNQSVIFHGQNIALSMPAGIALSGAATDLTAAFPSYARNAQYDIFPFPPEKLPYLRKDHPSCAAWPPDPPRANLYCEAGMLAHPIVSPVASEDWRGCCPIWLASGQEQVIDSAKLLVQTAHAQGVSVTLHEYEAMPHGFIFFFRQAPQTRRVLQDWAKAIISFAKGERPLSSAAFIRAKGLVAEPMDVEKLVPYTVAEAKEFMWQMTLAYKVPEFHKKKQSVL